MLTFTAINYFLTRKKSAAMLGSEHHDKRDSETSIINYITVNFNQLSSSNRPAKLF
jgi:hypothetical protein